MKPGQDFFLPAAQETNKQNLLEIFEAATPVLEEIAKVKPETWRSMKGIFGAVQSTVGMIGGGALKPLNMLQNRAMNVFEGVLAPVMVGINNLANQVESFAMQNQTGAITGAGIGYTLGYVLPGGPLLWAMIGGGIGAFFEQAIKDPEQFGWSYPFPDESLQDQPPSFFQQSASEGAYATPLNIVNRPYPELSGYMRKIAMTQR